MYFRPTDRRHPLPAESQAIVNGTMPFSLYIDFHSGGRDFIGIIRNLIYTFSTLN